MTEDESQHAVENWPSQPEIVSASKTTPSEPTETLPNVVTPSAPGEYFIPQIKESDEHLLGPIWPLENKVEETHEDDIPTEVIDPTQVTVVDDTSSIRQYVPYRGFTESQVKTALKNLQAKQDIFGNDLVPAVSADGTIIYISPLPVEMLDDPFPEIPFPDSAVAVQGAVNKHGGFVRQNPDGTVTFKPKTYVGPLITADHMQALSARLT